MRAKIPKLGDLAADVWVEERHRREMEVTQNPIEHGSPITDHAIVKARKLSVMFGVSNTPMSNGGSFGGADRVADARAKLFMLQDSKQFLDVITINGGDYKNCLLTGIGWSTNSKNPDAVIFELDLEEIIVTSTKKTDYEPMPADESTGDKTSSTRKRGEVLKIGRETLEAYRRNHTADSSASADELSKNEAAMAQSKKIAETTSRNIIENLVKDAL